MGKNDFSENPTIRKGPRHDAPAPATIAELLPHLDVLELAGQGGMGVVYKARQRELDRLVALKVLLPEPERDPSFAERFAREARALARLHHPNVVTIYDSGRVGDLFFFIMQYVDGKTLREVMSERRLEAREALAIISQICDALQYAHDEGVMHRDIKPENVLIDERGRVRIADFGLAKLLSHHDTDFSLTLPEQAMGTMHYMAPEQIENAGGVDHRADVYAVGVLFYELLTGELPIGHFPLPSERAMDRRFDKIVLHALAKEPTRRYQRVHDLKTDVDAMASSAPEHSSPAAGSVQTERASGAGGAVAAVRPARATMAAPSGAYPYGARSVGAAYGLWLLGFVCLHGIHRFYAGRWITGIIWLLTGGLCFIGQIVDLFLIPGMIRSANLESALLAEIAASYPTGAGPEAPVRDVVPSGSEA